MSKLLKLVGVFVFAFSVLAVGAVVAPTQKASAAGYCVGDVVDYIVITNGRGAKCAFGGSGSMRVIITCRSFLGTTNVYGTWVDAYKSASQGIYSYAVCLVPGSSISNVRVGFK